MGIQGESVPRWYIVHTYSGYENKVASNLEKIIENRGLENVIFAVKIPTETVVEVSSKDGTTKEIERKLFPCYVFVKMLMNDETWHIVRNTTGVTGFVGPGSSPVPLSEEELEKFSIEIKEIELKYEVGDSVQICDGQLKGFVGVVNEISRDKTMVKVTAILFGREQIVDLPSDKVIPQE